MKLHQFFTIITASIIGIMAAGPATYAQDVNAKPSQSIDNRTDTQFEHMIKALDLTDEQIEKLQELRGQGRMGRGGNFAPRGPKGPGFDNEDSAQGQHRGMGMRGLNLTDEQIEKMKEFRGQGRRARGGNFALSETRGQGHGRDCAVQGKGQGRRARGGNFAQSETRGQGPGRDCAVQGKGQGRRARGGNFALSETRGQGHGRDCAVQGKGQGRRARGGNFAQSEARGQGHGRGDAAQGGYPGMALRGLDLTAEQIEKIKDIRQDISNEMREAIKKVLTDEQVQELQARKDHGRGLRNAQ